MSGPGSSFYGPSPYPLGAGSGACANTSVPGRVYNGTSPYQAVAGTNDQTAPPTTISFEQFTREGGLRLVGHQLTPAELVARGFRVFESGRIDHGLSVLPTMQFHVIYEAGYRFAIDGAPVRLPDSPVTGNSRWTGENTFKDTGIVAERHLAFYQRLAAELPAVPAHDVGFEIVNHLLVKQYSKAGARIAL